MTDQNSGETGLELLAYEIEFEILARMYKETTDAKKREGIVKTIDRLLQDSQSNELDIKHWLANLELAMLVI